MRRYIYCRALDVYYGLSLSTFISLQTKFSLNCSPLPIYSLVLLWEQAFIKCLVLFISNKTVIWTPEIPLSHVSHSVLLSLSCLFIWECCQVFPQPVCLLHPQCSLLMTNTPTPSYNSDTLPPANPLFHVRCLATWELVHFPANQVAEDIFERDITFFT